MSNSAIKACIDVSLPDELLLEAMRRAIAENPNNAPAINPRLLPQGVMPDFSSVFLAAITGKLWQPGRVLRVHFLDGDPQVQARIAPFAQQWSEHANITFKFGEDPDAEIRISFQNQGSWSYLGTDALVIPKSQPTMNFGWLSTATTNDEYQRVVTHEFGHALGCIHEHQNPANSIPWDQEAVYRYYQGPPNYWTREQVDINLFTRYDADITQFSDFDPKSIMLYPIPNQFTIGDFEVGWNKSMSATDKQFISTIYPANRKASSILIIDAAPNDAVIGEFGEVDTYSFAVTARNTYRINTEGSTDVVMSLFGPDSPTRPLATDDDSGSDRNARIVINLRPGTYTLRVRHFSAQRTGGYRIGVTTEPTPESAPTPAPSMKPKRPRRKL
jgi:Bacterial pre-peptidase C-terminal domain/Astacin (Peptidase family M12A)